jgi:hypothetical protein
MKNQLIAILQTRSVMSCIELGEVTRKALQNLQRLHPPCNLFDWGGNEHLDVFLLN